MVLVTEIVFRYWVGIERCKDRFWKSEYNFSSKEPDLSFKDKAYWWSVSLCEIHGWRQEGVVDEGGHFGECSRFINKICEHGEVLFL